MRSIASGIGLRIEILCAMLPGGAALTGLQVHSRQRFGSPDRRVKRRLRE
ncbi:TPA: hypothetical protein MYO83_003330 [Klebsiella michiganensis]|nr:hypothetical protein [Klebsiella michiganensis]HCB1846361.1 hypothetical protein [Klebsiella oxytoca]